MSSDVAEVTERLEIEQSCVCVCVCVCVCIQGVNDIDCQKIMGDTSQSTYQKCLIQFCFIS